MTRAGRLFRSPRLHRAVLLCCAAGCVAGAVALARYVEGHDYFAVAEIVVETDGRLTRGAVLDWTGLALGASLFDVSARAVEERLQRHPRVRTASVTRAFPQRVRVTLRERRAIAEIRGGPPGALLDRSGESFVAAAARSDDLPYVSGLERMPLDAPTARTVLADVSACLDSSRELGVAVSEIRWDARQGYTLVVDGPRVVVRLGHAPERTVFHRLRLVLTDWPAERPTSVFDTRFADRIIVSPLTPKPYGAGGVGNMRRL